MPFWAKIGYAKKWIFLKNTLFDFPKIAKIDTFWVDNNDEIPAGTELILKFFSMTIWTHHGGTNGLTGRKCRKRSKSPWEDPNGPKILPTGIKHNYKSFWAILGPFRHPWGSKTSPKGSIGPA